VVGVASHARVTNLPKCSRCRRMRCIYVEGAGWQQLAPGGITGNSAIPYKFPNVKTAQIGALFDHMVGVLNPRERWNLIGFAKLIVLDLLEGLSQ